MMPSHQAANQLVLDCTVRKHFCIQLERPLFPRIQHVSFQFVFSYKTRNDKSTLSKQGLHSSSMGFHSNILTSGSPSLTSEPSYISMEVCNLSLKPKKLCINLNHVDPKQHFCNSPHVFLCSFPSVLPLNTQAGNLLCSCGS